MAPHLRGVIGFFMNFLNKLFNWRFSSGQRIGQSLIDRVSIRIDKWPVARVYATERRRYKKNSLQSELQVTNQRLMQARGEVQWTSHSGAGNKFKMCSRCGSFIAEYESGQHSRAHDVQAEMIKYGAWLVQQIDLIDAQLTKLSR